MQHLLCARYCSVLLILTFNYLVSMRFTYIETLNYLLT